MPDPPASYSGRYDSASFQEERKRSPTAPSKQQGVSSPRQQQQKGVASISSGTNSNNVQYFPAQTASSSDHKNKESAYVAKVLASGTSLPTYKQQASGGSILKVEGVPVRPSESAKQATEEARLQQVAERDYNARRKAELESEKKNGANNVGGKQRSATELNQSDVTSKRDNRSDEKRSATTKSKNAPPQSPAVATSSPYQKQTSEIWEFDTDPKSGCCIVQ